MAPAYSPPKAHACPPGSPPAGYPPLSPPPSSGYPPKSPPGNAPPPPSTAPSAAVIPKPCVQKCLDYCQPNSPAKRMCQRVCSHCCAKFNCVPVNGTQCTNWGSVNYHGTLVKCP